MRQRGVRGGMSLRNLVGVALVTAACDATAPPRPQLLVQIDTDAPLLTHALDDPSIALVAVVDTLVIDVIGDDNEVLDARSFLLLDEQDWPLSLGVSEKGARLRLRLFNGANATTQTVLGAELAQPDNGAAIDRLVDLPATAEGIQELRVTLSFDCMGALASFAAGGSTCIDAERPQRPPGEGVEPATTGSQVGTSATAREIPCAGARESAICVPGGFAFMGDAAAMDQGLVSEPARPMRPVVVSPFLMDVHEVTVGEFRAAWSELMVDEPNMVTDFPERCTWLGADDPSNDALPLNCVPVATAEAFCAMRGGTLPSEAQHEHAARGRGRGFAYPWGNRPPECCVASYMRFPLVGIELCGPEGPEPPGSHPPSPACSGLGDVSIDGVVDLAGSMREVTRDLLAPFDAPCWSSQAGVLRDPVCTQAELAARVNRGGSWGAGAAHLHAAVRRPHAVHIDTGFRCVYAP